MFDFLGIPAIAAICYTLIESLKRITENEPKFKRLYPCFSAFLGTLLGVLAFLIDPRLLLGDSAIESATIGLASGLSATGGHEVIHRILKTQKRKAYVIDTVPRNFYITGDKHRHFKRVIEFCRINQLTKQDVIIILGDSGLNYYGDKRDQKLKEKLNRLGVTFLCLHGNKENRPENIPTYGIQTFCGGIVYYEPKYPNLFFARDGEIYRFYDKSYMVIGGAHSVDKLRCLEENLPFWDDEMPSEETKHFVQARLASKNYSIDGFLTHTCPISCLPTEMFISTKRAAEDQPEKRKKRRPKRRNRYPLDIDRSTEEWLEKLKCETKFDIWYCGHYHVGKTLGKIHMLHHEILPLGNY